MKYALITKRNSCVYFRLFMDDLCIRLHVNNAVIMLIFSLIFYANTSYGQRNKTIHREVEDSSLIKLRQNLWNFYNSYNHLDSSFVWVTNATGQTIENARIIISNSKGYSDTITKHGYEGLYFIQKPMYGIYKIEVDAQGYEKQMQHIQVYPMGKFKKKISMGKPGDVYLPVVYGLFPLTNPSEYVSFTMNKLYKSSEELELYMEEFRRDADTLRRIVDPSDTIKHYGKVCLLWPTDSLKRQKFRQVIEESQVLKTFSLQIMGGCSYKPGALVKFTTFWIDETIDEKTIQTVLENNHFVINRKSKFELGVKYWIINATYEEPLSKEMLIDIQNIYLTLPVISIDIDAIVGAEIPELRPHLRD